MTARRVILLLDEANDPEEGLGAALRIETDVRSCTGVFLANEDLHRLAGLGDRRWALPRGRTGVPELGPWLTARREALRLRCATVARALRLAFEWRMHEGAVAEVSGEDLLVVPEPEAATWVGSPWPRRLRRPPCDVLFVNRPWASGSRILALDDGGPGGARARQRAQAVAANEALPLAVLPLPAIPVAGALVDACARNDARLLVVPDVQALNTPALLARLLELLDCSLLLCRAPGDAGEPGPAPPGRRPDEGA